MRIILLIFTFIFLISCSALAVPQHYTVVVTNNSTNVVSDSKSFYSESSMVVYNTLHPILQEILTEAIKSNYFDYSLVEGYRNNEKQNEAYTQGVSKAKAGESPHNYLPSFGVDIVPTKTKYLDEEAMILLAGHILSIAERLGYKLTNGIDWDRDGMVMDTNFKDFWHFELTGWKEMI